jgi:hypothetical protein
MVTESNARKEHIRLSAFAYPGDEKPPQAAKMICWRATSVNHQLCTVGFNLEKNSFLTEPSGNVIENKGSLWKTWRRSANVYENKGA